jgi:hypothetical protein
MNVAAFCDSPRSGRQIIAHGLPAVAGREPWVYGEGVLFYFLSPAYGAIEGRST